ncbi:uncharacterized protein LOC128959791 [Oppia nitens]|uniref:uncharacterized protein LOC128959791 n=1 Tax=Oppia nitens TaxID=1686743 RepID=UPI0023DABB06|nr:uncharacterized protein LOC128959791 [Oppia nitens]
MSCFTSSLVISKRYCSLLLATVGAANYWHQRQQQHQQQTGHKSRHQCLSLLSSPLRLWSTIESPKAVVLLRDALLANGDPEPFATTGDWFAPFVTIRPLPLHTDANNQPANYKCTFFKCSGIIYNESGLIITANTNLEITNKTMVCMSNGQEVEAEIVYRDSNLNLCALKIQNSDPNTKWPNISNRWTQLPMETVGTVVYTVDTSSKSDGIGQNRQVTEGIVAAVRPIPILLNGGNIDINYLQYTAYAYSSGCPVVDSDGNLVGLTTNMAEPNCSLCLNRTYIDYFANQTIDFEMRSYGFVICWYDHTNQQYYNNLGIPVDRLANYSGIMIVNVVGELEGWQLNTLPANSALYLVQQYDIITHINHIRVQSLDDLYRALDYHPSMTINVNEPILADPQNSRVLTKVAYLDKYLV